MKRNLLVVLLVMTVPACAPPIYVIDRPSVMEMESGGSFPALEEEFLQKQESFGPKMAPRSDVEKKRYQKRDYNILQGNVIPNDKS